MESSLVPLITPAQHMRLHVASIRHRVAPLGGNAHDYDHHVSFLLAVTTHRVFFISTRSVNSHTHPHTPGINDSYSCVRVLLISFVYVNNVLILLSICLSNKGITAHYWQYVIDRYEGLN